MAGSPPRGSVAEPSRPYVLAFFVDDALARELRSAITIAPVHVVHDLPAARAVLRDTTPPALVAAMVEDGEETALAIVRVARTQWPRVPIVLLGRGHSSRLDAKGEALGAEVLTRNGDVDRLMRALRRRVLEGVRVRETQRALAELFAARWGLSRRQHDCVRLLAYGVPQGELADRLGVTDGAVEQHLARMRERCREADSCGLIQRLLELAVEVGIQRHGWLRLLQDPE